MRAGEDGVRTLDIALWPTANTFRAGHRIRLQVSSGAYPLFNRNAGTGEPLATGANLRSADQEVFHDAGRPVLARAARRAAAAGGRRWAGVESVRPTPSASLRA